MGYKPELTDPSIYTLRRRIPTRPPDEQDSAARPGGGCPEAGAARALSRVCDPSQLADRPAVPDREAEPLKADLTVPDLSLLPPVSEPAPQTTVGSDSDLVEVLQDVLDEQESEVERRLEAVRRRREFRLIQGAKL